VDAKAIWLRGTERDNNGEKDIYAFYTTSVFAEIFAGDTQKIFEIYGASFFVGFVGVVRAVHLIEGKSLYRADHGLLEHRQRYRHLRRI